MDESLENRVARQFSSLYLTLVSVLVGLVLADLISDIHSRMTLWPLTWEVARTWGQISGNTLAVLAAWVTYSHLGLLRNRVPTIWDTVDAILVLVAIPLNAATGRHDPTAWFFWAAAYSLLGMMAVRLNVRQATLEPALAHVRRIGRIGGPYTLLYAGAPGYLAIAAACWLGLVPVWLQALAAATASISGVVVTILFMREWRHAVRNPSVPLAD